MATDLEVAVTTRARAIARAAAQWRDASSEVRKEAKQALAGGAWPAPVVEAALDNALWDLDEARTAKLLEQHYTVPELKLGDDTRAEARVLRIFRVLVVLPGNVIGPAIQSAFCAAIAGARVTLKASSAERHLGALVAAQFEALGPPLAGCVRAEHWSGGDLEAEADALTDVDRVIAFGGDATIEQIRSRAEARCVDVVGYGESYSIGYVAPESDIASAAQRAARDVCLFDQRGCMSPQTIYVAGDRGRAVLFARALASAIETQSATLPRAAFGSGERELIADAVRRLAATALEPTPHGLDTLLRGPSCDSVPEFVVAVEQFGQPTCVGFGRIVAVKPCADAREVTTQLKHYGHKLETIGLAFGAPDVHRTAFSLAGPLRLCALGDMQRPPFGYRPTVEDFVAQ
jgi:acyl-CoA reductase-like NAD-dependent aldehyde dehydrogenase